MSTTDRACPICKGREFRELVDFGMHPLAAHLKARPDDPEILHENLYVYCRDCHFVQIAMPVVDDEQYTSLEYFGSETFPWYINDLAEEVADYAHKQGHGVLEIGSNDGGFLELVRQHKEIPVLGFEPSKILATTSSNRGVDTINGYFGPDHVDEILERFGQPSVIVARFVLEHIWDLHPMIQCIRDISSEDTLIVLEVPDVDDGLTGGHYTTFWDQHVNYFNLYTFSRLLGLFDLKIEKTVLDSGRHENILRIWARLSPGSKIVESGEMTPIEIVENFHLIADKNLRALSDLVSSLKADGSRVGLYGATHYITNMVNFAKIGDDLEYALDRDEHKHGKFMPGSGLKIRPKEFLDQDVPEYTVIGPVGLERNIASQHPEYLSAGGRFITVLPVGILDE
jgi:C-methyltransferase